MIVILRPRSPALAQDSQRRIYAFESLRGAPSFRVFCGRVGMLNLWRGPALSEAEGTLAREFFVPNLFSPIRHLLDGAWVL